jgi:hypothetical protein
LKKWRATVAGKHIGVFNNPEEAAHAYDYVALNKYGEFAVLNFPDDIVKPTLSIIPSNNTSGYRGVHKSRNKWNVNFKINGIRYRLFVFDNPQDAAMAYDKIAIEHLGDKAKLNFSR